MTTAQMKYFIETAKCLSFSEAAMRLYISQPSLSRHIFAIESELNVRLFIRERNLVRLTAAGKALLAGLENVYEDYLSLVHDVQMTNRGTKGHLRLGVLEYQNLPQSVLTVIKKFADKYPGIKIDLSIGSYSELKDRLHKNELDMAITLALDVHGDEWLGKLVFWPVPLYIVVHADHRHAHLDTISVKDLPSLFAEECFLIMSPQDSFLAGEALLQDLRNINLHPRTEYAQTAGQLALWLMARRGVAVLNSDHVFFHNPRLKFICIEDLPPTETAIIWEKANSNPVVSMFVNELEKVI